METLRGFKAIARELSTVGWKVFGWRNQSASLTLYVLSKGDYFDFSISVLTTEAVTCGYLFLLYDHHQVSKYVVCSLKHAALIACTLGWRSDLTVCVTSVGLINHCNWVHCSVGMTANFCWKLRGRALLITHCVPDIGLDALMYINHLRHTHSVGCVVASHFKGEKTETQASELGQGHTTNKDWRAKTQIYSGVWYTISFCSSGDNGQWVSKGVQLRAGSPLEMTF